MTENIDLVSTNLCIPEDAFEQFQAVSMYQEEEYITLTDLGAAPKHADPGDLSHLTYDNEVVVTTEDEVNSTVNNDNEYTELKTVELHNIDSTCVNNTAVVAEQQNALDDMKPKKLGSNRRGRKKKQVNNDEGMAQDNFEALNPNQNNDNTLLVEQGDPVVNSTVPPRRRGRRPRSKPADNPEISSEIPPPSLDQSVADISVASFSSDPENVDTLLTETKRRRGRPRKTPLASDTDKERLSELSGSDSNNPATLNAPRRRGRPKKVSLNSSIDNQIQQVETTTNNITGSMEETNVNSPKIAESYSIETGTNMSESAEPSRRTSSDICFPSDINMSDDNDWDDISLSQLKMIPDTTKSSHCKDTNGNDPELPNTVSENINNHTPEVSEKADNENSSSKPNIDLENSVKNEPGIESITSTDMAMTDTIDDNDDVDDICLSELKNKSSEIKQETSNTETSNITEVSSTDVPMNEVEINSTEVNGTPTKRNTKMPIKSDFEYNIDSVLEEPTDNDVNADNSLLVEDTSKRPTRRKTKKLHYEEESDEDPYANIELSDDDSPRRRKGNRYYSDDEYIPGRKGNIDIDSTDSEANEIIGEIKKQQKKKITRKRSDTLSPRKKLKKEDTQSQDSATENTSLNLENNDIEVCLDSTEIKVKNDDPQPSEPSKLWGTSNEFENFLAKKIQGTNLQIKKVSSSEPKETKQLEIPMIDPGAKKMIESCSQTNAVKMVTTGIQTTSPNDIPMKETISLTPEQAEKACFFLNGIVKTTAELGTLMTQKSEDFITKKINTTHVTDTMKMDYCVKKSFLLFKLAKHNLMQMEEDLAKQYEKFLQENNLSHCREVPKQVVPSAQPDNNSDSDCEIVEGPIVTPVKKTGSAAKPKFNPKTVFLNKELSIKIAKKPTENKKLDIKGRHTVWINDTVMVKKVKPTQSFLAQDSRNKKPPDSKITTEMVSNFFENYYRQRALSVCAPFVTTDWLRVNNACVCNYFVVTPAEITTEINYPQNNGITLNHTESNSSNSATTDVQAVTSKAGDKTVTCPEPLFKLCFRILKNQIHNINYDKEDSHIPNGFTYGNEVSVTHFDESTTVSSPEPLFTLCFRIVESQLQHINNIKEDCHIQNEFTDGKEEPVTLFRLCLRALTAAGTIMERSPTPLSSPLLLRSLTPLSIPLLLQCPTPLSSPLYLRSPALLSSPIPLRRSPYMRSITPKEISQKTVLPLKVICYRRIVKLLYDSSQHDVDEDVESVAGSICSIDSNVDSPISSLTHVSPVSKLKNGIKPLFSLCVEFIQNKHIHSMVKRNITLNKPKLLKLLAFEYVKQLLYGDWDDYTPQTDQSSVNPQFCGEMIEGLTINSINTLSEEAFLNLERSHADDVPDSPQEYFDDFDNEEHFEENFAEAEDDNQTDTNWVAQVQMKELRSCVTSSEADATAPETLPVVTQIKIEPLDDDTENVEPPPHVKTEPTHAPDEMTMIPDVKAEAIANADIDPIQTQSAYDVDSFEQFVATNKMMLNDGIFSQSALRIRRQHEPDYEEDGDMGMSLLVPQTFEPLAIETVKGSLMESSSDEESSKQKKVPAKKKPDKRKTKQKKPDLKTNNKESPIASTSTKDTTAKDKATNDEVANLTKRLRDKIRQEEKKDDSTDSDSENLTLNLRSRKDKDKSKQEKEKSKQNQSQKSKASEIQCSNVDSTDQLDDDTNIFTGFTAIDQNEISTYQKYMQFVYDKIIPGKEEEIRALKDSPQPKPKDPEPVAEEPLISNDEPVELLECEPTMPIFDDAVPEKRLTRKSKAKVEEKVTAKEEIPKKNDKSKKEPVQKEKPLKEDELQKKEELSIKEVSVKKEKPSKKDEKTSKVSEEKASFIERHGWHCYSINPEDTKLYQSTYIPLEKLPESFVQTYFEYQGITRKDKTDQEIDRLTNLNSLNRSAAQLKEIKQRAKSKKDAKSDPSSSKTSEAGSRADSPTFSNYGDADELEPSDDEGTRVEDEVPPPVSQKQTENTLAKSFLMDDNDSEADEPLSKIKQEPSEGTTDTRKGKGGKSKKKEEVPQDPANLMLTADKMMNKELTLLHAPIVLKDEPNASTSAGPLTRNKHKSGSKHHPSGQKTKNEEDSSSEEEKQWVTTKEKLLKRLGKKEDNVDDAKRAKIVSEFIERRGVLPDSHIRPRTKGRRSSKKFLERQKQLRVLSRELFGESSDGTVIKRSKAGQFLYKGRRNIRKVIDKKSLARSTVIANMEEFERKRRLNARQTKLRELLGCEEGVNVLVINDEVCLEYDFDENRPVVTIHPFFTKVMKAHQYEGVKFMWDACFESLAHIESGHPGGGCILAHCMGLGKTLQVLALLHTVLTHPRVGMQRVLVCCPLSTVLNWVDEIHKWIGPVTNKIKVFELSKLKKTYERAYQLEDWYNGGGIFIIGYELFRSLSTLDAFLDDVRPTIINKIRTALLDPGPDIIVCDEGHLLKNDCSVLAVAMSRVVTKRRIVLTGTPMQNNLREYYCMVNFVKPNLLGTYYEYSNRFENPIMNGQHRDSRDEDIKLMKARTHILHKVLEGCLQRQEASVLYPYLPKKHEYTVFITLTQCQWDLYKHYIHHYAKQNKQSILKDFHTLQKIWSHPQVLHNFQTKARDREDKNKVKLEDDLASEDLEEIKPNDTEVWWLQYLDGGNMLETLDSSNKFVVVFRILDECIALGDKVLIFSTSLFCLDALEYFLKKINKWSLGQEYYRLDGSVPAEVRQKWCREFNADNNYKTKVFLVSTRAGCLGLNMTAANRVIIMDTSWNPAHDIQSIFRVYRFGQKKDCYIYRLVAMGTMEQKIYERAVTKQAVACRVVDEQQIDRHYNMAELTELYRYDESGSGVTSGVAVGVQDVALLRVARHAALHAVHEHDSLLRGSSEQNLPEHERNAAWMQFQQEHAHKQMENSLVITNSKVKKVPNILLKRVHSQDGDNQLAVSIKSEDNSDDFVPNEPKAKKGKKNVIKCYIPVQDDKPVVQTPPESRSRGRPRKNAMIPVPSTSKEPETITDDTEPGNIPEDVMVEKITDILLQHNFQNKKGGTEISKLVMKVRQIVKRGFVTAEDMADDLTSSIARILLPKQIPLPRVTDIMCESLNKSSEPTTITDEPEMITSDPTPIIHRPGPRSKRKAALAAAKNMDSLAQDIVINLDDDDNPRDTDFVPDADETPKTYVNKSKKNSKNLKGRNVSPSRNANDSDETRSAHSPPHSDYDNDADDIAYHSDNVEEITPQVTPQNDIKKISVLNPRSLAKTINTSKTETLKKPISNTQTTEINNFDASFNNSILLSDDDDVVPEPTEPSKTVTVQDVQKSLAAERSTKTSEISSAKTVEKTPEKAVSKPEDDEVVPLPVSLLKNQNFINIVAHTYLRGNPMLDEDAATLAAQYSTLKALKEVEQTGKELCSGPIYDIAIKVIGKAVLKKMASVNPTAAHTSAIDAAVEKKEQLIAAEKNKDSPTSLRDSMINEKLGIKSSKKNVPDVKPSVLAVPDIQDNVTVDTSTPVKKVVVPVGLIKTGAGVASKETIGQQNVECILPDDDDVIINNPPPEPKPKPIILKMKAPIETIPIKVTSGSSKAGTAVSSPQVRPTLKLTLAPTTSATPTIVQVSSTPTYQPVKPPDTHNSYTICLDSDEEEPVMKRVQIQPPANTPTKQPVPVSLTMANAPGIKLPLPPMPSLVPCNQPIPSIQNVIPPASQPQQTLVLRQVNTRGNTQTKFVLVNSDQLPTLVANNPEQPVILDSQSQLEPQIVNSNIQITAEPRLAPNPDTSLHQARCKPGDILRISKTGKIEVIPRGEASTATSQPQVQVPQPQPHILQKKAQLLQSSQIHNLQPQIYTHQPQTQTFQPQLQGQTIQLQGQTLQVQEQSYPIQGQTLQIQGQTLRMQGQPYQIQGQTLRMQGEPYQIQEQTLHMQGEPYQIQEQTLHMQSQPYQIQGQTLLMQGPGKTIQFDGPTQPQQIPTPQAETPSPAVPKEKPKITSIKKVGPKSVTQPSASPPLVVSKPKEAYSKKQSTFEPSSKKILSEKSRVISSSSSSSSSSRESSPERSPLSILKDVVHIQAPDYVPPKSASSQAGKAGKQSIVVRNEKYRNCNIGMQHVISDDVKPKPRPPPNPMKNAIKLKKVTKNELPAHVDKVVDQQLKKEAISKKVTPSSTTTTTKSNTNFNKYSSKPSSASSSNVTSKLLKSNTNLTVKSTTTKPSTTSRMTSSTKSKSNVPSTSKVSATVDLTNYGKSPSTSKSNASVLKTIIEPKKRTSTVVETPPVKKKKSEPMTLKDFNLDDFDDIIELE